MLDTYLSANELVGITFNDVDNIFHPAFLSAFTREPE